MKRLCFFHEILNRPYEMYHEIQFMVYVAWVVSWAMKCVSRSDYHGNSWHCRDFMSAVPMKR